jgi:hypothetical protein
MRTVPLRVREGRSCGLLCRAPALSNYQVASLTNGDFSDECWTDDSERLLIGAVDALHDSSQIDDELWARLAQTFDEAQLLDLLLFCGRYHAISFAANGTQLALEEGVPRFTDVLHFR